MSTGSGWPMLFAMLSGGCDAAGLCSSDVVHVVRAPAGDRYAVVELRNCGATTGYVTVVRVGRASQPQRDAREAFTADGDHGAAATTGDGALAIGIAWIAPARVRITYPARARVLTQRAAADGVAIAYGISPR